MSQSLLCVGGPGIQKECNHQYPNGIQAGDIAETSGGNLKCDVIYHGALLPWKDSGSVQVCSQFNVRVFREIFISNNCIVLNLKRGHE